MRIAICDDNENDLQRVYELTRDYFMLRGDKQAVLERFQSVNGLTGRMDYDIYILDILIGEQSGIDLAKEIRNATGLKGEIIFTTSCTDFALDAFSVNAKQYLLKPVKKEKLYQVLNQIMQSVREKKPPVMMQVKTADGMEELITDEIVCVEYTARIMKFHMRSGRIVSSIYIRSSFEDNIRILLQQPNFIQTHKSFVINMDHVQRYHQNEILMSDGMPVPVSRSNTTEVRHQYMGYLSIDFTNEELK
ncbi:MAG: LytTR family DNA-binding domain-containing protein [bacterium]|nr:LytTR family DNA-binding domain-containing protein [bacterium]